ncbi:3-phosphoshikimate 1-carboxyvinyltransferase [Chrysiogenes arsenatis]|uniref:3-phosphoshikimate 1-carboxyvinyltransferase n=1 Tax=Chrysiogenes arsenatis TaxID=309797 RepID=UPI0004172C99|nr:3-phosphoshikimate 1-carboxyvinyltransferase [Chrysiogenes arsenatis]
MLQGSISVASDKSITHRAIMFSSLAKGTSVIENPLMGDDNLSTVAAFEAMGVTVEKFEKKLVIHSPGSHALHEPKDFLDFGNSGTTTRLMLGILSGLPFFCAITGDQYLRKRPMMRVVAPLRQMGAHIDGREGGKLLPLSIRGGALVGQTFTTQVASAQVKSALLLAGAFAKGTTVITEPEKSRDHTERMLPFYGVPVEVVGNTCSITGGAEFRPANITVPGDISSAAFFLVAATVTPGSSITIENVGVNPSRTGVIEALHAMNAAVVLRNTRDVCGEPVADLEVRYTDQLQAVEIGGSLIPRLIDEIPALAVAMSFARGTSVVRDAQELRVKETDRIKTTLSNLQALGVQCEEREDGFAIHGNPDWKPSGTIQLDAYGDHRIGMSALLFKLLHPHAIRVRDTECISVSFPNFETLMQSLQSKG